MSASETPRYVLTGHGDMQPSKYGTWVRLEHHERTLAALREELAIVQSQYQREEDLRRQLESQSNELRSENERLRVVLQRIAGTITSGNRLREIAEAALKEPK